MIEHNLLPILPIGQKIQVHSAWAAFAEDVVIEDATLHLDGAEYFTWLTQKHTSTVVELTTDNQSDSFIADAAVTSVIGQVCAVKTADCVPILLFDAVLPKVAAIHAGWRGLANGIVANTMAYFPNPSQVQAYIGPCISQEHFEIGQDVLDYFLETMPLSQALIKDFFLPSIHDEDKWCADLSGLVAGELVRLGVSLEQITQSGICTYSDPRLPSYRFDKTTQRMTSMVWLTHSL